MVISNESLSKIKELLNLQKQGRFDFGIYSDIINIINENPLFDIHIMHKQVTSTIPAYTEDGIIYYSNNLISYIENYIKNFKSYSKYDDTQIYNYIFLECIFHEIAHIQQLNIALAKSSEYDILNKLYFELLFCGRRNHDHYDKHRSDYFHEYNANLEALKVLYQIYPNNKFLDLINLFQIKTNLMYYFYKNKFISERTFDSVGLTDKSIIKVHDVPTNVLIMNGLPVSDEIVKEISNEPIQRTRKKYII